MLETMFIFIAGLLVFILSLYKLFICKLKRTSKTSLYISFMTGILLIYILSAVLLVIFEPEIWSKIIILIFGLSPFIIGRLATYEKENMYSWIQIGTITLGIFYVLLT